MTLLESALARPHQLLAYGTPDIAALAACYAGGISRNHPFVDGNKRTAWLMAAIFLDLNGYDVEAEMADALQAVLSLAAGALAEEDFAAWLRERPPKIGTASAQGYDKPGTSAPTRTALPAVPDLAPNAATLSS